MESNRQLIHQTANELSIDDLQKYDKSNRMEISVDRHGNKKYSDVLDRTSSLSAPIMLLTGHTGEVYSIRFHPSGSMLVSAGHDRNILIWNTSGDCDNISSLKGHKGAVTELAFSFDGDRLLTSSIDKSVGLWDFESGARIRNFKGHSSFVNACAYSRHSAQLGVSASDDGTMKVWDMRSKQLAASLDNRYPNLTCCFNSFGDCIISGGIDNEIKVWDIRALKTSLVLQGHLDSVTGIRLSKDGAYLISNAADNSVRMWDIYPYCEGERCLKMFFGHIHNYEKNLLRCCFSPDSKYISSGSGDACVYIWDCVTRSLIYKLPGHQGSVNDVEFHPTERIIASCSSDKNIYLGELHI